MTAKEAIESSPDYSPFEGTITVILMGNYHPFMKENKIYCTGTFKENGLEYGFITINADGRILYGLPHMVDYQIQLKSRLWFLWKRIDDFFKNMIITAEFANNSSELVQLRIICNLIYALPIMSKEDKIIWTDWIRELYWNRKAILNKWYIENVLPF